MSKIISVYGTPYIEVEFGQRDEGWKLFIDEQECIKRIKTDSKTGAYDGGYIGPIRPLCYYEIPFMCLSKEEQKSIKSKRAIRSENHFSPKFKSDIIYIKE